MTTDHCLVQGKRNVELERGEPEVVLETERLVLRRFQPDDLDDLASLYADPQVMRFWPRPMTREETQEWLNRAPAYYAKHGIGMWATLRKPELRFVGRCGLMRKNIAGISEYEVGYMIAAAEWGQGLAPEAARAIISFAFERFGPPRVIALIRPENLPSRRVAEKLGLRRVGELLHADLPHDLFAVNREEWRPEMRNG